MHASCSICGDLFTGTDIVHSTPCGHIFHYPCLLDWLRRVPNCPHCRAKVDERKTIKLYFQLNDHRVEEDSVTLTHQIHNLQFQLSLKEHDLNKAKEEAEKAKTQAKDLRSLVREKENAIRSHETTVSSYEEQIKVLKSRVRRLTEAELETEELKKQIRKYETVEKILEGSAADAADALDIMKDSDPSILCSCISTLKKELSQQNGKYKELQKSVNFEESKYRSAVSEIGKLEKRISILNRSLSKLKEDLTHTERENENLKTKCKHLEEAIIPPECESNSSNPRDKALKRLINEYPVPNSIKKNTASSIVIDLASPSSSSSKVTATTTSGISPISPLRLQNEVRNRSLLNNKRLLNCKPATTPKIQCYDGLGGHVAEEVTRTDRSELLALTKNKINKLVPAAKRMKSGTSTEKQKSTLLSFINKQK